MRPSFSLLNLLLVTTIVALIVVVFRLGGELAEEKSLRAQLLQKGGILQVRDPSAVHVVQVSTWGEQDTLRWRVYVPNGRSAILSTRLEAVPADKPPAPRLPPNAIVVAERSPANPVKLGPGENVVSVYCDREKVPYLHIDVVGSAPRTGRIAFFPEGEFNWFRGGYRNDITYVEHTAKTAKALLNGETVRLENGKTFVLCRYRSSEFASRATRNAPRKEIGEVLIWLQPDEG